MSLKKTRLHKSLSGEIDKKVPIWFMRQAGRYLPEYRALRASEPDFIAYCLNSQKAAEATLQPIKRFDLDAAIIFSDILMIPWALGCGVEFVSGLGPRLKPLERPQDIDGFCGDDLLAKLKPVAEAVSAARLGLDCEKSLIGFCGGPWTVATYMIEGGSSRDFARSRKWLWGDIGAMENLIDRITHESVKLLTMKAQAGADVLMIFDSWAGAVPSFFQKKIIIEPMKKIIKGLRDNGVECPVIGFPKGIGGAIVDYAHESGVNAVGLDHGVDLRWADRNLPKNLAVQGNLDPLAVVKGGKAMLDAADEILDVCTDRPHIFNLGHGFVPETPIEHVQSLIDHVRARSE